MIAGIREKRRERSLRAWTALHRDAGLIWPFIATEHPAISVNSLIERLISRALLSPACAMHLTRTEDEVWLVEFRTTPLGRDSSPWFTLVAHRCQDAAAAKRCQTDLLHAANEHEILTFNSLTCQSRKGLMSVALLDDVLNHAGKYAAFTTSTSPSP